MEWNFSHVQPSSRTGRRGSATTPRPVSAYGLVENGRGTWEGSDARKSVFVGNGFGGLLAVPVEGGGGVGGRPTSRGGKRESRGDLWR